MNEIDQQPPPSAVPPVAILAGGLGTRLGTRVARIPKPLVEVAGEPFLFHLLRRLGRSGVTAVVLCVGYLGEQIEDRVGPKFGEIEIAYSYDAPGLDGTLGALRRARALLADRFLVHYGDTILRLNLRELVAAWDRSGLPAILAVLENQGRWGTSNCEVRSPLVVKHDKAAPSKRMRWIDYGVSGLTPRVLDDVPEHVHDLSTLYKTLADRRSLAAFPVSHRFYEIGSPAALREAELFLSGERGGIAGPVPGRAT